MLDAVLQQEKIAQAIRILNELQLDCWLTFVRETDELPDPACKLLVNHDLIWPSIFLLTKSGRRIAIVARYDDEVVHQGNLYSEIYTYVDDFAPVLIEVLTKLNPVAIALNYAVGDVVADGLTHGMYLQLREALKKTPYPQRFVSAAPLISRLRGRKTTVELACMRHALQETEAMFALLGTFLGPGVSEQATSEVMHGEMARRYLGAAWSYESCPAVKFGPDKRIGQRVPGETTLQPGFLASLNLGVRYRNYCSDLQRLWYQCCPGESSIPDEVQRAFQAVKDAIRAGKALLQPGVQGWQVDAAARASLVSAGYPEYQHALGHSVGRCVHDGGPLLGPRWARYGETPYYTVEAGLVFALELGVMTGCGYVGLEDEVLVTSCGCEWFSQPQEEIYLLPPAS